MDTGVTTLCVYSIGHSDHPIEAFLALLQQHAITLVADVRSQPYSQWAPQFNRENLARQLEAAGLHYAFLGDALGGRPAGRSFYDPGEENPNYERLAASPGFLGGLEQLLQRAATGRVAILCSEGDFHKCHRHKLITPALLRRGVRVWHIAPDGTLAEGELEPQQLSLGL